MTNPAIPAFAPPVVGPHHSAALADQLRLARALIGTDDSGGRQDARNCIDRAAYVSAVMGAALASADNLLQGMVLTDEEGLTLSDIRAALALAGGDTVAGTAAGPDYEALARAAGWSLYRLQDGAGATPVEFYAWRGKCAVEPDAETSCVPDEATAWRDACEHDGLAGDTTAAMSAPQDGGEVAVDIAGALQIVIDLARGNLADERDMPEEYARQIDAINQVEDMAVNQFGDA